VNLREAIEGFVESRQFWLRMAGQPHRLPEGRVRVQSGTCLDRCFLLCSKRKGPRNGGPFEFFWLYFYFGSISILSGRENSPTSKAEVFCVWNVEVRRKF